MNKKDIEFRKSCQLYSGMVTRLLKQGRREEAKNLINNIEKCLEKWENVVKSARFKVNILKSLLVRTTIEEKRFVK